MQNIGRRKLEGRIKQKFQILCRVSEGVWNKKVHGNLKYRIRQKQMELERLQAKLESLEDNDEVEGCKRQLKDLVDGEEVMWR